MELCLFTHDRRGWKGSLSSSASVLCLFQTFDPFVFSPWACFLKTSEWPSISNTTADEEMLLCLFYALAWMQMKENYMVLKVLWKLLIVFILCEFRLKILYTCKSCTCFSPIWMGEVMDLYEERRRVNKVGTSNTSVLLILSLSLHLFCFFLWLRAGKYHVCIYTYIYFYKTLNSCLRYFPHPHPCLSHISAVGFFFFFF